MTDDLTTITLRTERLLLRPVGESDSADLFALLGDRHAMRYWDEPPWEHADLAAGFIQQSQARAAEGSGVRLIVADRESAGFLGWCAINDVDPDFRSAGLSVALSPLAWGRGYATEGLTALLDWAFPRFDLNRVQAETDTRNLPCARLLEKVGFRREGTLRQDCVVEGVVSDTWVYGLIASDRS